MSPSETKLTGGDSVAFVSQRCSGQSHFHDMAVQSLRSLVVAKTRFACPQHGLRPISNLQLTEDIGDVIGDRLGTEDESLGDGGVALTLGYEVEDLPLALREFGQRVRERCGPECP